MFFVSWISILVILLLFHDSIYYISSDQVPTKADDQQQRERKNENEKSFVFYLSKEKHQ
jgi:hypothetical protein